MTMPEKEYIEREKLNDMLEDFCVNESFYDALQTIPSADVAPVRHGRWYYSYTTITEVKMYICSRCRSERAIDKYDNIEEYEYCPHCGAKMDEKERDENA